ncbi:MAG: ABC transporter substrate-binding protein [Proteobacteria bacterium]|nr:ABC transporter substrate-binding protein [Pseudomonadota bacterium]
MKHLFKSAITALFIICFFFSNVYAIDKGNYPVTPKMNKGKKWRVGYLEGGPYGNYPDNLRALVAALSDLGWAKKPAFPPSADANDTKQLWSWISKNLKSDYLEFVQDAYWSNNWDDSLRPKNRQLIIERLNQKKDIDLMLAMGTWAGQDLANNEHSVPTIVMSASNPIASKIAKSVNDSGYDHLNARVDPTRYERQIRIFYDIFKFKRLGVVLEKDTIVGRSYAAIDDIEKVAGEKGFKVITCNAPFSGVSMEEAQNSVLKCHEELAPKVDAFYITVHRGVSLQNMDKLLAPLMRNKTPTFSQLGTDEVKHGVLLSIARAGFKYIARFHAETIAKIFNGAKPHDLEQLFEDPPRIAINLKTAKIIGYKPGVDILGSSDEVFKSIAVAK